jgi:hypothetical protein
MIDPSQYIYGYKFRELQDTDNGIEYFDTHGTHGTGILRAFFRGACSTNAPVTLVTHNSDFAISQAYPKDMVEFPENLIWYSTNVDIDHPNIRSIPIGLENPEWHPDLRKSEKIANAKVGTGKFLRHPGKILGNAMFNPTTHPSRPAIQRHFFDLDFMCGAHRNGTAFDHYISVVVNSIFTVCPRGNGIDTHRLWEALYLGSIPIVEDCINIRQLAREGVPMMIVPDLTKVTVDELLDFEKVWDKTWNRQHETLTMDYWINKIRNRK